MRPPLTTVEQAAHAAAAAYLMKHAGAIALMVLDARTGQPIGIITQADIARAVADGKDVNNVRIYDLMTTRPTVISTTTSVRDAASVMTSGQFRHLPVVGDTGLVGIVDITDVCRADRPRLLPAAHGPKRQSRSSPRCTPWPQDVPRAGGRSRPAPVSSLKDPPAGSSRVPTRSIARKPSSRRPSGSLLEWRRPVLDKRAGTQRGRSQAKGGDCAGDHRREPAPSGLQLDQRRAERQTPRRRRYPAAPWRRTAER
jgi:hypothetical protein